MTTGIRKRFDNQIKGLEGDILDLINSVKKQHQEALLAIENHNYEISKKIIKSDQEIRAIAEDMTAIATWRIASQQPVAQDLRKLTGYMHIIRDLERISNYAKNISKFNVKYKPETDLIQDLKNLMATSFEMMDLIAKAIEDEDITSAYQAAEKDKDIDNAYKKSMSKITDRIKKIKDNNLIEEYAASIQQLKYIERLGDHLVNICETIVYIITGKFTNLSVPTKE